MIGASLVFSTVRCSPLAQSIPKVRPQAANESAPSRNEVQPLSPSIEGRLSLEAQWLDASRYRPSALQRLGIGREIVLDSAQLDALVLNRRVDVLRKEGPEELSTVRALILLDLSTIQIERSGLTEVRLALEPSEESPTTWSLVLEGGKEEAILTFFDRMQEIRIQAAQTTVHPIEVPPPPPPELTAEAL
jgi:hypothetical protein